MVDPAHLVGAGGALGALLRHLVAEFVDREAFPLGTVAVNVLGTFALGLVTFAGAGEGTLLLVGIGACGSFTTFSSFSVDAVRLWEDGERTKAIGYAVGTLVAAGVALGAAWLLARGL
ncbi:chromosome condensation protein CrcB [Halobacteriales archaeon QS_1_68_20]|nr:MAG: chromosome condensation protein CrcB [Halobacteriales archaeon QS_1_68_20]